MFQVRLHGRGGQGVVTAAELLASAAFREDRYAQAFPSFGSERMGAPVMLFCRIDDKPIRTREPVTEPDALLVNSSRGVEDIGLAEFAARNSAAACAAFDFVTDELDELKAVTHHA